MNRILSSAKSVTQLFLVLFIGILLSFSSTVHADVEWSYTFDSSIPSDWDITHGEVEVDDGVLTITNCTQVAGVFEGSGACFSSMWIQSGSLLGTWSFDYYRGDATEPVLWFYIASEGVSTADAGDATGGWPNTGYCLFIGSDTEKMRGTYEVYLGYTNEAGCSDGKGLREFDMTDEWHNIVLSRNGAGIISFSYDGEILLESTHNQLSMSENINIEASVGDKLDNVTYNSPETSSPSGPNGNGEPTDNGTLFAVGGMTALLTTGIASRAYYKKKESLE